MERRGRVNVLLDTHVLLWAILSPASLTRKAFKIIANPANAILVSAASAWEIATKVRLGRLAGAERLPAAFFEALGGLGDELRPIPGGGALPASRLPTQHRQPL